jgi:hypothetical protein
VSIGLVELQVVTLAVPSPRPPHRRLFCRAVRQRRQPRGDPLVALGDLAVMEPVQLVGLLQGEEVLRPPRPLQRPGDLLLASMALLVARRASRPGSRSPWRMASMIAGPVTPVMSLTTSASFTSIGTRALQRTHADSRCAQPSVRGRLATHQVAASLAARRGLFRVLIRTYSLAA